MTALPDSDAATSFVLMPRPSNRRRMASATAPPSMMAPSTMLSGGTGSLPNADTLYPLPAGLQLDCLDGARADVQTDQRFGSAKHRCCPILIGAPQAIGEVRHRDAPVGPVPVRRLISEWFERVIGRAQAASGVPWAVIDTKSGRTAQMWHSPRARRARSMAIFVARLRNRKCNSVNRSMPA